MAALIVLVLGAVLALTGAGLLLCSRIPGRLRKLPEAASRFAALEAAHAEECLAALTSEDVEWLTWWSWEPPPSVTKRLEREAEAARWKTMTDEERIDELSSWTHQFSRHRRGLPTHAI